METKKQKIVSAVATMGIFTMLFGATYAYFAKRVGYPAEANITLISHTTDLITFSKGDAIQFEAGQETFAEGKGNASGSTYVQAMLTANSETNTATDNYSIYVIIDSNTFTYSLGEDIPEILLTVTDNDGNVITANPETIERWTITMTFINYNENQNANAGKKIVSRFYIKQEPMEYRVGGACKSGDNLVECLTRLAINGDPDFSKLYYHDSNLKNGAGDNSARFAGADELVHNYVCFGSDEEICPNDNLYRIIGVFDGRVRLIKADYATSALLGTDTADYGGTYLETTSYYQGDSSNLTKIAGYYWNKVNYDASYNATNYSNDWSYSELNKTHLNKNYLANIGKQMGKYDR